MSENKSVLRLTTWERVSLLNVLGELRGDLATLRKASKAMDALELQPEEQELVGYQTVVTPQGDVQYQWLVRGHVFDVEIADPEALSLIRQAVDRYQGWRVADLEQVEALMEKLRTE